MRAILKPFGSLKLTVDSKEVEYRMIPMKTKGEVTGYSVDFRGKIVLTIPPSTSDTVVTCTVESEGDDAMKGGPNTGQDLAASTFDLGDYRLSIGTVGDLDDRKYEYPSDGLRVILKPSASEREIAFCVATKQLHGNVDSVDTWLAADVVVR